MTNTSITEPSQPWWRYPMVWLMISGPLIVVVAGILTVVIAYHHIDPVLETYNAPHQPEHLPAVSGRNLAADMAMRAPTDKTQAEGN